MHPSHHVSEKRPICFGEPDFPLCPRGNTVTTVGPRGATLWFAGEGEQMLTGTHSSRHGSVHRALPPGLAVRASESSFATSAAVRRQLGNTGVPRSMKLQPRHACCLQDSPDPKSFFSSRIDPRAPAVRWLLCASVRVAKTLAWKLLRGFCSRLTVHYGIQFT